MQKKHIKFKLNKMQVIKHAKLDKQMTRNTHILCEAAYRFLSLTRSLLIKLNTRLDDDVTTVDAASFNAAKCHVKSENQ